MRKTVFTYWNAIARPETRRPAPGSPRPAHAAYADYAAYAPAATAARDRASHRCWSQARSAADQAVVVRR